MDRRKLNGGHSTKSKGLDKRKNEYRKAIHEAITPEDVMKVFSRLYKNALEDDIQAQKLFLEYTLGKPVQQADITTDGEALNIPVISFTNAPD